MALVPSGRWRMMVAQTMANDPANNDAGVGAAPPGTPAPRNDIQQEQLGGSQQATGAPAPDAAAGDAQNPQLPGEQMGQGANDEMSVEPVSQDENGEGRTANPETSLKAYIFQVLEKVGVPHRQLQQIPDLFSQEADLDTNTVSGHYLIPTYTRNHEVDEKMAYQLAREVGQKFGLSQKIKLEHRGGVTNWRVSFTTVPKASVQQGGSSFDALQGALSGGAKGQARAAFTLGEMIKARRDDLYDTMRKIAKGS